MDRRLLGERPSRREALDYLPTPPASLENGPNAPCPGAGYAWGPGQWVWQQTQYNWQPGYWYQTRPDWVWNPACYQSTPSGCVYNSGFWDYNLSHRGVAFAPVAFDYRGSWVSAGSASISYRPSCVLPTGGMMSSLFVRPNYGHYCFGDYYGASATSVTAGARYVPWFEFRNNRVGYDPIYSTMACQPNRSPDWDRVYREDYHSPGRTPGVSPPTDLCGTADLFPPPIPTSPSPRATVARWATMEGAGVRELRATAGR